MYIFNASDIVSRLIGLLELKLPAGLNYHSVEHTRRVLAIVERLGNEDGLELQQIEQLRIAAAGHDVGFIISRTANEPIGAVLTAEMMRSSVGYRLAASLSDYVAIEQSVETCTLTQQAYRGRLEAVVEEIRAAVGTLSIVDKTDVAQYEREIEQVVQAIHSTALLNDEVSACLMRRPQSELSGYLLDADLSVFGQVEFKETSELVMRERGIKGTRARADFLYETLAMMEGHRWFTVAAKRLFSAQLQRNIHWLKGQIGK